MDKTAWPLPKIWHSYLSVCIAGILSAVWPIVGIVTALLVIGIDRRLWQPLFMTVAVSVYFIAFGYGALSFHLAHTAMANPPQWLSSKKAQRIIGTIISVRHLPGKRLLLLLENVRPVARHAGDSLPGICAWTWQNPPQDVSPIPGQTASFTAGIRQARGFANSPKGNYENIAKKIYWRTNTFEDRGKPVIAGEPEFFAAMRHRLRARFIAALAPMERRGHMDQARAILLALLFGDRSHIEKETQEHFSAATLAHSLALSGQHLCIALLLGLAVAGMSGKLWPRLYLYCPKPVLIAMASIPFAIIYLWIGNAPPSLIRAAVMLMVFCFWLWQGRPFCPLDLLCATLGIILLFNPLAILDTSLQLSVLCVAIIVLIGSRLPNIQPLFSRLIHGWIARPVRGILQILWISLTIQIFLLPLVISKFHMAGFWFPLNALWLPALGFIVLPLAAAGLFFASVPLDFTRHLASFLLDCAAYPCELLLWFLETLAGKGLLTEPVFMLPHWTVFPAFALLAVLLAATGIRATTKNIGRLRSCALLAIAFLAIAPLLRLWDSFDKRIILSALDVGQGQSILLRYAPRGRILLDGGGIKASRMDTGRDIVHPRLGLNTPPRIQAILNTHPDYDHLSGLFHINDNFTPDLFFHNGHETGQALKEKMRQVVKGNNSRTLFAGDQIILGDPENRLRLKVLHPPARVENGQPVVDTDWSGNGASLILRLDHNGKGLALFTGDADISSQWEIMERRQDLAAKILFTPHHGSDRNLLPELYESAKPSLALISCGAQNRWRFPGKNLLKYLAENDIPVLDTGKNGRIDVVFSQNGAMTIKTVTP